MRRLRAWLVRLGTLLRGDRRERDMAEEFEAHLQLHIDDNLRAGMTPEAARRAALVKFGPVEAIREDYRDRAGIRILEILRQDLRYAARRLTMQPGFAMLVVATIALGVGANAAMFGFVDALLLRTPLNVRGPDRLVEVNKVGNYPRYLQLSERLRSLDLAAATYPRTQSLASGAAARPIAPQCVTPGYFGMLGVRVVLGRAFTAADDGEGSGGVLVLSHAYWTREFSADPSVLGRTATIARRPLMIVGVAPRGFQGLGPGRADAWTLVARSPEMCSGSSSAGILGSENVGWLTLFGRLRDGFDLPQARAELAAIEAHREPFVARGGEVIDMRATLSPLYPSRRPSMTGDGRLALWLTGGAGLLLLLACANVAGLLSMRAVDRRREVAIRLQLGASRGRVAAQLLIEHLVMASLGGAAALLLATWLNDVFAGYFTFITDPELLDARMLLLMMAVALAAGFASGMVPALNATRPAVVAHLRSGQAVVAGRSRARSALLAAQVALALVLAVAAGLFVRSVDRYRADFAYDLDQVIHASVDLEQGGAVAPPEAYATFERLQAAARRLPMVEATALTGGSIGFGGKSTTTFMGVSEIGRSEPHELLEVTAGYHETLGLRITRGRAFTAADERGTRPPLVLNELLAKDLFGHRDPLGQCVFIRRQCHEVVGVSEPFRATPGGTLGVSPQAVTLPRGEDAPQALLIRTRGSASEHVATFATALQGAAPGLPHIEVRPLTDLVDLLARSWRLGATVFTLFGALAVLLAAIGIYGALAFSVRQRTVEIGVRLAFGAARADIARLTLRHGICVVLCGSVIGVAAAFATSRFVGSLLFNVAPDDPATYAAAAGVIAAAALAGCLVPAWRAARVDPAVALRYD